MPTRIGQEIKYDTSVTFLRVGKTLRREKNGCQRNMYVVGSKINLEESSEWQYLQSYFELFYIKKNGCMRKLKFLVYINQKK